MKTNKILLFTAVCGVLFTLPARAQRKIDPTVEVKKDFDGKMLEIHKSRLDPSIADSLSSFNLNFDYTIFNKPYKDMYEFNPLPSARIHSPVTEQYPYFFAKVGLGYPLNPNAEIYYQPNLGKKGEGPSITRNTLLLKGYYNALWDKISLAGLNSKNRMPEESTQEAAADNSVVGVLADYRHIWTSGELSTGIDFSSNYYTYYGFDGNTLFPDTQEIGSSSYLRENASHTYNKLGVHFNIGSVDAKGKGAKFNYKLRALYQNTSDHISDFQLPLSKNFQENLIKAEGEFGPTFGRYNQFLVGINSETALYSGVHSFQSGVLEFIPQYKFGKGRFLLNLGVRISISYSSRKGVEKYHNAFSPQADISYEIVPRNLWIYAVADGGNQPNSYSSLLEKNKWLIPTADLRMSSIPFRIKGGLKGKVFDKFSYDVYINYTRHNGLLQFINSKASTRHFTPAYSNHNEFSVGGELNWQTKVFSAGAKLKYSNYSTGTEGVNIEDGLQPAGYAPLEGSVFAEYNWRERIYFGADLYFRNQTPFYLISTPQYNGQMKGFANLGVHARYVINNNLAVFIQGGNLLNAKTQYHPYYIEKGINFGAGLTVKF